MKIENELQDIVIKAIHALYGQDITKEQVQLQKTKREFEGHITLIVFPFLRVSKKNPEQTGLEIGEWIIANSSLIAGFNVIKGFLNLSIKTNIWLSVLNQIETDKKFGIEEQQENAPLIMVEYSSPNTNKPLHLGHIRNNLLGVSISNILKANGKKVVMTNIVNDRGIHICKSMLAWQKWGEGETPQSSGKKGDHLVGHYYVRFDKEYKKQIAELISKGITEKEAEAQAPLMIEIREMLLAWEAGDATVINLWSTMNSWVYAGFDQTYKQLGVSFDKIYYESDTYLIGRDAVLKGVDNHLFYKRDDGSIWVDLTKDGLDEKILLRADGTSVYITQDIGTAKLRFDDYPIDTMVYVVGNEQDYHFKVLSMVLDKLGYEFGKGLIHFSYGMVELPDGKMKSREGTVVDADDMIEEMKQTAHKKSDELGKLDGYTDQQVSAISYMVGMAALKYFILKVDPKKNMTFNPDESIDFNGNTGPFIQYTHARIQSVLRRAKEEGINIPTQLSTNIKLDAKEEGLIQLISEYKEVVKQAGDEYNPALIANYIYELVKEYNQFYHDFTILKEKSDELKHFRLLLSSNVAKVVKSGMGLLGCDVPDRM